MINDSCKSLFQVIGIDGNYRLTCESVMRALREHKDSVLAVLEAFVYDPLLNWRLMDSGEYRVSMRHFEMTSMVI
jgi:FKBP12-rapamycin complex-associated protein